MKTYVQRRICCVWVCLTMVLIATSCRESIKNCEQVENKEVLFINKTPHKKTALKSTVIADSVFLNQICATLFEHRKRLSKVNVREHKGYFELIFSKTKVNYFDMIYTDYDGTVFRLATNEYYQNDSLVSLLESKFILPEE